MRKKTTKILVVSDTHGRTEKLREVIRKESPIDVMIHAGDLQEPDREIRGMIPGAVVIVRGNNDYFADLPDEIVYETCGHSIYVTHGHRVYVSGPGNAIINKAKMNHCDIAIFGHIHRPVLDQSDEAVTLLNPGSLSLPRQEGRKPSYAIIEIDEEGQAHFSIRYLEKAKTSFFF